MIRRAAGLPLTTIFLFFFIAGSSAFAASRSVVFKPKDHFRIKVPGVSGTLQCGQKKKEGTYYSGTYDKKRKSFTVDDIASVKNSYKRAKGSAKKKLKKRLDLLTLKKSTCAKGRTLFTTPTPTPAPPPPVDTWLQPLSRPLVIQDIQHLYRRAGLGSPPDAAAAFVGRSAGELVDYFMTYREEPALIEEATTWLDENPAAPHYPQSGSFITNTGIIAYAMTLLRKTQNPFHERLALLTLGDRLVVSSDGITQENQRPLMLSYIDLLRRGAQDHDYRSLLKDMGEHGAMIKYLTLDQNKRTAPNENYARELMELFSLGTTDRLGNPNYTNDDIREVARAFTGWNVQNIGGIPYTVIFNPGQFDTGVKTIFAGTPHQANVRTGRDVVDHILTYHPGAGGSLARFFTDHYLSPQIGHEIVDPLGAIIHADNFNVRRALRTLLASEIFYHPLNRYNVPKSLPERIVHLWRVMDRAEIQMPFDFLERVRRIAEGKCVPTKHETVFGCLESKDLQDGQELIRSFNQSVFISRDNGRFTTAGWTYARYFPVATPSDQQLISHMANLFGIEVTESQRGALTTYLNNTMNNDRTTLRASPFNPTDANQVRRRVGGLFILFANMPQVHDVR